VSRGASENKSRVSGAKELPERASDRGWKKFEKRPKFETLVSWYCSVSCHPQKDKITKKKKAKNEIYAEKNCSALLKDYIYSYFVENRNLRKRIIFQKYGAKFNYSKRCAIESELYLRIIIKS